MINEPGITVFVMPHQSYNVTWKPDVCYSECCRNRKPHVALAG